MEAIELKNRMILLVTSLVALAIPAAAGATELRMTNESGALVPIGTEITGTANNSTLRLAIKETTLGEIDCESIMLNGEVTKNSDGVVEATGRSGSSTTNNCRFQPTNKALTIGNIELSNLSTSVTGTGSFDLRFEAVVPGGAICKIATEGPGTFTFAKGSDVLEVVAPLESAACGESTLVGKVTLETAGGGAVVGV